MKYIVYILGFVLVSCQNHNLQHINGLAQGSTYSISYIGQPLPTLKQQIDSIIEVIDLSMSTYRKESIISKFNDNQQVTIDSHFKNVFLMSKEIHHQSEGFFDPSIGSLINLWGFGTKEHRSAPSSTEIDSVLKTIGLEKIHLNEKNILEKENPYIQLNFNAIAQGYTCDVIANFLKQNQISNFIVEVGGEMVICGKNLQKEKAWVIGIDNPLQNPEEPREIIETLETQGGLATSGNYRKVWTDSLTGQKYVHTLNPKTGYPQTNTILSATVIAPTAMQADAYATSFMAIGLEKTKLFLSQHPEIKALILHSEKNNPDTIQKLKINF